MPLLVQMLEDDPSSFSYDVFDLTGRERVCFRKRLIGFALDDLSSGDFSVARIVDILADQMVKNTYGRFPYHFTDVFIRYGESFHLYPRKEPVLSGAATPDGDTDQERPMLAKI